MASSSYMDDSDIDRDYNGKMQIFPDWLLAFIRTVFRVSSGICLMGFASLFILSLISYDPHDPSLNSLMQTSHAELSTGKNQNWIPYMGSYSADLFFQFMGYGAYFMLIALFGWGYRLVQGNFPRGFWWRLPLLFAACLAMSLSFALLAPLFGDVFKVQDYDIIRPTAGLVEALLLPPLIEFFSILMRYDGLSQSTIYWSQAVIFTFLSFFTMVFAANWQLQNWFKWPKNMKNPFAIFTPNNALFSFLKEKKQSELPKFGRNLFKQPPKLTKDDRNQIDDDIEDDDESLASQPKQKPITRRESEDTQGKALSKKQLADRQTKLPLLHGYQKPDLSLLRPPPPRPSQSEDHEASLQENARQLEFVLQDFSVKGEIVEVSPGPVVTLYSFEPAPGIKTSRVISLADDVARSMSATSVRISTMPGRSSIGIELPNAKREMVPFYDLLESKDYIKSKASLPLILGKDISGAPQVTDLATMPHLLIAGTTGSGKSVGLNAMILSLLFRHNPEDCRFIMIDPKMLELSVYNDIPHLLTPVVTDPKKAVVALKWTVREMEDRYRAISTLGGVRNIDAYNKKIAEYIKSGEKPVRKITTGIDPDTGQPIIEEQELEVKKLPYIVVVVDEMADLMLVAGKEIEASIQRLAQMARAAGIHIIMATQRPSVDVITGTIKANFPTRISFMVTSKVDARTVMGEQGAEQLLGKGDMLIKGSGGRISRIHGPFVEDDEVEHICDFIRSQGSPDYLHSVVDENDTSGGFETDVSGASNHEFLAQDDEASLYDRAVAMVAKERKCSTSYIQRYFKIGYNRAADIVDQLEQNGVISAANHAGKREVLIEDQSS